MKPIIAIPSYNRPDAKIFNKLSSIKLQKFVFVRKEQYKDYVYLQDKNFSVITLPTSIGGKSVLSIADSGFYNGSGKDTSKITHIFWQ